MKALKFFLTVGVLALMVSCKKDGISTGRGLYSNADTLKFDTVFTSVGSVTRSLKIINDNNEGITLSSIKMMGGTASPFRLNINGTAAQEQTNINIPANDSIYLFVSVFINPNNNTNPFILADSISYSWNGNTAFVQLQAYGRNAVFLRNDSITVNTSWSNTLPYVIIGNLKIKENATLSIPAGTRIYAHANAFIDVYGSLDIEGTKTEPVIFRGDRLDDPYSNQPAGWDGIYFNESSINNRMVFAELRNAYNAVVVDKPATNSNPKLLMQQCIIDNAFNMGLFASNTSVNMNNCLVSNCGRNVLLQLGGNYEFINCTMHANYTRYLNHINPAVTVQNYAEQGGSTVYGNISVNFINCIIWGSTGNVSDELVFDKQGSGSISATVQNCIYRAAAESPQAVYTNSKRNEDPVFDNIDLQNWIFDFHINGAGPGVDAGISTLFVQDLDGNNRSITSTDIGCYEKQ